MEDKIKDIAAVVGAVTALIIAILALHKNVIEFWNKILLPLAKFLAFLGILVIPIGVIVWFFFDLAARNSNRLEEHIVFLALIAQVTVAVSVYALFWGIWVYPRLRFLLARKQPVNDDKATENKSDAPQTSEENNRK